MHAIGVDLGGTKIAFGVIDENGNLITEYRVPKPDTWSEMRKLIGDCYREFSASFNDIVGLGFGAAGLISLDGYAFYSPNVAAFDNGAALQEDLTSDLPIPVIVDNDNNCSGYAEAMFGNAKGFENVLVVGLGTGIGGAYIFNGQVLRGAHGFAGEFGHFTMDIDGPLCACGKKGCFESLASGSALGRIAREYAKDSRAPQVLKEAGSISAIQGIHVKNVAANGGADGLEIMDEYGHNVAIGLVSLTNIFDPEIIVISGGVVEMGDTLLNPVSKYFLAESEGGSNRPLAKIVLAKLGERAGVIGAGALAMSQLR